MAMQQMVTVDRLELLLSHLVHVIQENVTDATALRMISAGIAAVVGSPPS